MAGTFTQSFFGRPGTTRTYSNLFKNHIEPNISPNDAFRLKEQKLQCMIQQWLHDGLHERTIKQLIRLTLRYSKWLGGIDQPDVAPILRKLGRQKQETIIRSLTFDESRKFLNYLENYEPKLYMLCLFGLHAGLRRGEIFGLKYGDIDALKNRITVSRSYKGPTKNGRTRQVPLSARLAKALENIDYLTKSPEEPIFTYFDPNFDIKRVCQLLKIRNITIHDLRHTFATLALESQVSPRTVQTWLGHSSLSTTLNIYWSSLPAEQRMDFAP